MRKYLRSLRVRAWWTRRYLARAAVSGVFLGLLVACGETPQAEPAGREAEALARMEQALSRPDLFGTAAWQEEARVLAEVLWPEAGPAGQAHARRAPADHMQLLIVVGDVARQLETGTAARDDLLVERPVDMEILDGGQRALGEGARAWRAWVEGPGAALLERKRRRLQEALFGARR